MNKSASAEFWMFVLLINHDLKFFHVFSTYKLSDGWILYGSASGSVLSISFGEETLLRAVFRKNQNNNIRLSTQRKHCWYANEWCFSRLFFKYVMIYVIRWNKKNYYQTLCFAVSWKYCSHMNKQCSTVINSWPPHIKKNYLYINEQWFFFQTLLVPKLALLLINFLHISLSLLSLFKFCHGP